MIELCDIFSLDSPAKQQVLFVRQPFNLSSFRAIFGVAIFYGSRSDSLKFSVSLSTWRAAEVFSHIQIVCFERLIWQCVTKSNRIIRPRAGKGDADCSKTKLTVRLHPREYFSAFYASRCACVIHFWILEGVVGRLVLSLSNLVLLSLHGTYYTRHQAPRAQRHFELCNFWSWRLRAAILVG